MANYVYPAIGLIGGTAGFLDAIDGTNLADKDMAYVTVGGITYHYILDADSAAAEASPGIIQPDANGGDKRWLLTGLFTGVITESPRAATWQFASWNPSDIAGTETLPSDTPTATLLATGYMTMGSASGVMNFEFTKAGNYLVSISADMVAGGNAFTSMYSRLTIGGTATRYLTPTNIYNQAVDLDSAKNSSSSIVFLVSATANQTVTIAIRFAVTQGGGSTANYTINAVATAAYVGT